MKSGAFKRTSDFVLKTSSLSFPALHKTTKIFDKLYFCLNCSVMSLQWVLVFSHQFNLEYPNISIDSVLLHLIYSV